MIGGERPGNDFFGIDLDAEDEAHEDGKLGARVETAHVFCGIGLGVAPGLSLGQHFGKLSALLHLAQDEIAGSIENALDAFDAVARHALFEAGNHGDSPGYSGAVFEMAAPGRGQPLQFNALVCDELLIGGNDAFAGFQRAARPGAGGIEAADQLHNHIHVGGKHGIGFFAPDDARGHPVHALARHAAIEYVGQLEALRPCFDEDARHRAADRAKTEDGDAQMAGGVGLGGNVERRCGTVHSRHLNFPSIAS